MAEEKELENILLEPFPSFRRLGRIRANGNRGGGSFPEADSLGGLPEKK